MKNINPGDINVLPEGCLANILSLTSPTDVARQSAVSSTFRSAADSDDVWEKFLPSDYRSIVSESSDPSLTTRSSSKKHLYLSLSDNPIFIDGGKKSFWLDKCSGKKCYMLLARDLSIAWGDNPCYWRWIRQPISRFDEVAMLDHVYWPDICGKISTSMLSPKTNYAVYFLFDETEEFFGFDEQPVDVSVGLVGTEGNKNSVYLAGDEANDDGQYRKKREDRWFEIELGEFFCDDFNCGELEMRVSQVKDLFCKGGLIVEGIMLRPKEANC